LFEERMLVTDLLYCLVCGFVPRNSFSNLLRLK